MWTWQKKKKKSQSDDEYKFKRNKQTQYKNKWNKVYFSLRKVSMINYPFVKLIERQRKHLNQ